MEWGVSISAGHKGLFWTMTGIHLIRGVIFNRMSAAYYEILKPLAEDELGIAVLGYFRK